MLLKNPYQSKTLKYVKINNIIDNINKYIIIDYIYIKEKEKIKIKPFTNLNISLNPIILYGLSDIEKDIPIFNHPIINENNNWIALDLRNFTKLSDTKDNYEIRNESEYLLAIYRFILSGIWYIGKENSLYTLKLPHIAFATWLSDNLTKKFGLDLNNQLQLRILSLIYYSKLFTNIYTEENFNKLLIRIKDDIVVPNLLKEIYNKIDKLDTIDDFCRLCYTITNNIRLSNLDFNVLVNIISNNWISSNSKELVILSLEHPPTWITLVYSSLTQRSFKKSYIGTLVDKLDKRGSGEEFIKALIAIIKDYVEGIDYV